MFSALEKFDIFIVFPIRLPYFNWDISITNLSLYVLFVLSCILFINFLSVFDRKFIPNVYQLLNEYILKFIFNIVDKQIELTDIYMVLFYLCCFYLYYLEIYLV